MTDFPRPYPVQPPPNAWARWVLNLFGWKVLFEGLPAQQGMLVVYPHTSNWDFVVMIFAKWSLGVQVQFWGKDKLFAVPLFGRWLRWLGGVPVDRTSPRGVVAQAVEIIQRKKAQGRYFWLALAPEGTRKYIPGWRSGFYLTAVQAGLPLGAIQLDYARREVRVLDFIALSGEREPDMARIASLYTGVQGLHPEAAAPVQLLDTAISRSETAVQ